MPTSIQKMIKARQHDLGGFSVRRLLPAFVQQSIGPFIFFDHIGPVTFAPDQGPNVRPHPHIGLITVTYLFEGHLIHRDNTGAVQTISPHDVNWMVAGSGIVHSERTAPHLHKQNWSFHGIQTWLALPKAYEEATPQFLHFPQKELPFIQKEGIQIRILAGHFQDIVSPIPVFSHTLYVDAHLRQHHTLTIPNEHKERAVYLINGQASIKGEILPQETLILLKENESILLTAHTDSHLLLIGGDTLDGHRHIWWNFVASEKDKIEAAKEQWLAQSYPPIPGETEFIPLPNK